jgi:hypothetical protein
MSAGAKKAIALSLLAVLSHLYTMLKNNFPEVSLGTRT